MNKQDKKMHAHIKVIILSNYILLSDGIERIIETAQDISVVDKKTSINTTINSLRKLIPDVIIIDDDIYKMETRNLFHFIEINNLPTKILLLTNGCDEDTVLNGLSIGAHGFLPKHSSSSDVINAIRAVKREEVWATRRLMSKFINQYSRFANDSNNLTKREQEVTQLIVQGLSNKEISDSLFISEKTVKSHITRIFTKTNVNSRIKLALKLFPNNL